MTGASNDELTQRGWTELERLLEQRGERSFPAEYERLRERLLRFFRWKGISSPDEYVDATFDRVARTLAEGAAIRDTEPAKYILGVARYVYLEHTRSEVRLKKSVAELPSMTDGDPHYETMLSALEGCLDHVSKPERDLLARYHTDSGGARIQSRRRLAEQLGISLNTLRIRMHRIRLRLEDCVRGKIS